MSRYHSLAARTTVKTATVYHSSGPIYLEEGTEVMGKRKQWNKSLGGKK